MHVRIKLMHESSVAIPAAPALLIWLKQPHRPTRYLCIAHQIYANGLSCQTRSGCLLFNPTRSILIHIETAFFAHCIAIHAVHLVPKYCHYFDQHLSSSRLHNAQYNGEVSNVMHGWIGWAIVRSFH